MSSEIERRIKSLEQKIITSQPCKHALPLAHSDEEAKKMIDMLDRCPRCSAPSIGPRVWIIVHHRQTRARMALNNK